VSNDLAPFIDHTLLRAEATEQDIRQLCRDAARWNVAAVCVNPSRVALAAEQLAVLDSEVEVCTVVGFPLGASPPKAKALEAEQAVADGALEVDMVLNIGYLLDGRYDDVCADIATVRLACAGVILKVILETALLSEEQIRIACQLAVKAGADWVKTSTGMHSAGGASLEAVRIMKDAVGEKARVKASGGIRTRQDALDMIEAGAERLGVSATQDILSEE